VAAIFKVHSRRRRLMWYMRRGCQWEQQCHMHLSFVAFTKTSPWHSMSTFILQVLETSIVEKGCELLLRNLTITFRVISSLHQHQRIMISADFQHFVIIAICIISSCHQCGIAAAGSTVFLSVTTVSAEISF